MKKSKSVILIVALSLLTILILGVGYFMNTRNDGESEDVQVQSTVFESEQDVEDFCIGITFRPDFFNISTTVSSASDVKVIEYSGSTAIVRVYFDLSEVYGRSCRQGLDFKIGKRESYFSVRDFKRAFVVFKHKSVHVHNSFSFQNSRVVVTS